MVDEAKQSGTIDNSIIIGRCSCDDVVKYTSYWCEEIIEEANKTNFNVIDLQKENFIEEKFSTLMEEHNPKFVFLNGHGDSFSAKGFNQTNVITANKNDYLLKGKIAHILSCHTAIFLAQSAMDKGCLGYIGYKNYFWVGYLEDEPETDIISKMFQEAVNIVSTTLLNGGSVEESFDKSQNVYEKKINECKRKYFNPNTTDEMRIYLEEIIKALMWNKRHQVYFS